MNGPEINGEPHSLVLLLVRGRRENGQPRECQIVLDDESIKVEDGMEFITAFIPTKVLEVKS